MKKIPLEILGLSSSQSQSGSFALILGEKHGKRRLPIIIGMFEAQSIAIQIEKINPNRPLTHDLFKSFAQQAGLSVVEIVISDLREGVFFSRIVCTDGEQHTFELDARPSDAIAIGLRFGVPIYTVEQVLAEAGIILSDLESDTEEDADGDSPGGDFGAADDDDDSDDDDDAPTPAPRRTGGGGPSSEELSKQLAAALEREDYEKAAQIRDELNQRGHA